MFVLRRSLVALPFLLIALPIPFTTPGETLFAIPGLGWTLTMDGMLRFGGIMFRAWLAIQSAILLTATTPFPDLLWALGALRVPDSIVATIAFMYRYLFVLGDEALRMLRARASRSPRFNGQPRPSLRWQGRVAGGMVGNLFLRSLARSERVYAAMLARGFDGRMRSRRRFAIRGVDRWVFFSVVVFVVSLLGYTSLR
jgi:cobalt/nickel transport system permease protein